MGKVLTITGEEPRPVEPTPLKRRAVLAEQPDSTFLLERKDEQGRRVYFYDCQISGLHRRLFGPFTTKARVYELADIVLDQALRALCDCQNTATDYGSAQEFVELPAYMSNSAGQPQHKGTVHDDANNNREV